MTLLAADIQGDPALGDAAIRDRIADARTAASDAFWADFDSHVRRELIPGRAAATHGR